MPSWPWRYFTREELQCKCGCGRCEMDPAFMREFELHRHFVGVPFIAHSGFRCLIYDERIREEQGQEGAGRHSRGCAIDGHWQKHAQRTQYAWQHSMFYWNGGIGLYLKGGHSGRFIHYDGGPWRVWTY